MNDINIKIIYPVLNANTPDTTIVWVSEIARIIDELYKQLFGKPIQIEIKNVILDNDPIDDPLSLISEDIRFVFPILSSEYLKNEKYLKFLKSFAEDTGVDSENKYKIFMIARKPVINDYKEDWLYKYPIYNLFEKVGGVKGFRALDFSQRIPEDSSVWEKLIDIAYDVHDLILQETKKVNQIKVFLAETTADQELYRDKIKRELTHNGYTVLPKSPLPVNPDELKSKLESIISECDITIHIMGGIYGDYIKSGAYSLIDYQNRVVRELLLNNNTKKHFQRIIWIPPYLKIPDQRQELYLRRLKREETDEYTEIIQAPLEDLKSLLKRKLHEHVKNGKRKETSKNSVYIIHDYKDSERIKEIEGVLQYNHVETFTLNYHIENIVESHFENLKQCDGVLIYYNGFEHWIDSKLNDLKKVWGYGRKKPFKVKALLLDDNGYQNMFKKDMGDVMKLIWQEGITDRTLQPFINLINTNEDNRS